MSNFTPGLALCQISAATNGTCIDLGKPMATAPAKLLLKEVVVWLKVLFLRARVVDPKARAQVASRLKQNGGRQLFRIEGQDAVGFLETAGIRTRRDALRVLVVDDVRRVDFAESLMVSDAADPELVVSGRPVAGVEKGPAHYAETCATWARCGGS